MTGNFFCIPNAVVDDPAITPDAMIVYASLKRHWNQKTGRCDVSYDHIMLDWKISRKTVAKGLKELKEGGYLIAEKVGRRCFYQFPEETSSHREPVPRGNHTSSQGKPVPVSCGDANKTNKQDEPIKTKEIPAVSPKKSRPLPEDFVVTDHMRGQAIGYGVPAERVDAETAQFMDYHRMKGTLGKDWEAGWRTWMRNAVKYATQRGGWGPNGTKPTNGQYKTAAEKSQDAFMRYAARIGKDNETEDAGPRTVIRAHVAERGVSDEHG
jgi:biotin operon repressor